VTADHGRGNLATVESDTMQTGALAIGQNAWICQLFPELP